MASISSNSINAGTPEKPVASRMRSSDGRNEGKGDVKVTSGSLERPGNLALQAIVQPVHELSQPGISRHGQLHDQRVHNKLPAVFNGGALLGP